MRQPHVALLVDRVVEPLVGHRRHRHPHLIEIRRAEHQVERRRSAAAPPPHPHARRVDVRELLREPAHTVRLIRARQHSDRPVDAPPPRAPARRRRAAIVDARNYIPLLRQHQVPQIVAARPLVDHRLPRRLAVHVEQHRILLRRIEVRRGHHPRIEQRAVARGHAHELHLPPRERRELRAQLGIVRQRPHHRMTRQPHDLVHRRRCERRVRVQRELCARRHLILMRPNLPHRRHTLGLPRSIEPRAIEIELRRRIRRRREVNPPRRAVDADDERRTERRAGILQVECAGGQRANR